MLGGGVMGLETQKYTKDIFESVNFANLYRLQHLHQTAVPGLQLNLADS